MSTAEAFRIAMPIIFSMPCLIWRLFPELTRSCTARRWSGRSTAARGRRGHGCAVTALILLMERLVRVGADWCGLHFIVGAFLAGAILLAATPMVSPLLLKLKQLVFRSAQVNISWEAHQPVAQGADDTITASRIGPITT